MFIPVLVIAVHLGLRFGCLYLCFLSLERKPLAREHPIIHLEGQILASVVGQILASVSGGQ